MCLNKLLQLVPSCTKQKTSMALQSMYDKQQKLAEKIFDSALKSVNPSTLVQSHLKLKNNILTIFDRNSEANILLSEVGRCYVIGFGKAVLPMAEETVRILGPRVGKCILSVPVGTRDSSNSFIEIYHGAKNNLPDENAVYAAQKIIQLVQSCDENDLLVVLISGGGSALLPAPVPPITLQEKSGIIKQLSIAGATINELNTVRKRISLVKGGGIVRLCKSKKIISLILSDVLGDPLDVIASGPTVPNLDDPQLAWSIVQKYIPDVKSVPQSVQNCLQNKESLQQLSKDEINSVSSTFVIGSNKIALEAAANAVSEFSDFVPFILTANLMGIASEIGAELAPLSLELENVSDKSKENVLRIFQKLKLQGINNNPRDTEELCDLVLNSRRDGHKICLLLGGEPVVVVKGSGSGGRNQELVLAAALKLYGLKPKARVTILSAGTDGIDGPCTAAGAVANPNTIQDALKQNVDPVKYLSNNDSFNFYQNVAKGRYHIFTGLTGTNVMDVIVILIE